MLIERGEGRFDVELLRFTGDSGLLRRGKWLEDDEVEVVDVVEAA